MSRAGLAILISGRGSNMQAIIDACDRGELDARVAVVIGNNPGAAGLERAAEAGIPTHCVDHRQFATREDFDRAVLDELAPYDIELALLAGFMRILTPVFIEPLAGRLLNIHPSLLPRYRGLDTHQRAIDAGDREAGVTVHFVTPELDGGPPVLQARVPILSGDTAATLADRVIEKEHVIYPLAVRWHIQGRLALRGDGAYLDGELIPPTGIQYTEDLR
ncbi:MAG: phosphoribosylglycinamide formyltransferase [Halioglobus sp.]|nr:phosphoribosylglycinamide formyltransferase [Halioglobus sp.]